MLESTFPTIIRWLSHWGPVWRVSTWWPSDSRDASQHSLLRLLSVAHRERLETAPLVANLAEEHRGIDRRRFRRLARRLSDGTPLIDALEQTPDVLSDDAILAIRFGSQTGTLTPTYQHLVERRGASPSQFRVSLRQTAFYAIFTLLILVLAFSFLAVFILPLLKNIGQELAANQAGPEFPWTLKTLVAVVEILSNYGPWLLLGLGLAAWLVWSSAARRWLRRVAPSRVYGMAPARSAELLRLLSFAADAGRPLPGAISTLARYHFDKTVRQQLLFARNEIEQGTDVWTSLVDAQLLTPQESDALAGASSGQTRCWAMRRLADCKQAHVARRCETLVKFIQPAVTLIFAAIVLLICSAMFGFLSQMIQSHASF